METSFSYICQNSIHMHRKNKCCKMLTLASVRAFSMVGKTDKIYTD